MTFRCREVSGQAADLRQIFRRSRREPRRSTPAFGSENGSKDADCGPRTFGAVVGHGEST